MASHCTFNDVIEANLPARRKRFSSQSLPAVDRLLERIGEDADPVAKMFSCLSGKGGESLQCRKDWALMVRGHALDLYDTTIKRRPLPHVLGEAIHVLVRLRTKSGSPDWTVQTNGLVMDIRALQKPKGKRPRRGQFSMATMPTVDLPSVERALTRRSELQSFHDARYLHSLLPSAPLPLLTLATGALQALVVVGDLTDLDTMDLDDSHAGWSASLRWKIDPGAGET